jgi:predicted GIY-YIG superfamily endonuclease
VVQFDFYYATEARKAQKSCIHIREIRASVAKNISKWPTTAKYNCVNLVYYKWFETIKEAIAEEKRIKGGNRKKKEEMINGMNPEWKDLYEEIKLL